MTTFELVLIVVDLMFIIPVLMAVGIMLGFHTYYIFTNTTTIEAFQKDRVEHEVRKQRVKSVRSAVSIARLLGPMLTRNTQSPYPPLPNPNPNQPPSLPPPS